MTIIDTSLDPGAIDRTFDSSPFDIVPTVTATTGNPVAEDSATARGPVFWICRYLPAEIAGTAALVLAGLGVTLWTDSRAVIALAGYVGSVIGFYAVLAVTLYAEQAGVGEDRGPGRSIRLLREGSGTAELIDTLLVRPVALLLGVWLISDVMWGLLAGKLIADVVFYSLRSRTR